MFAVFASHLYILAKFLHLRSFLLRLQDYFFETLVSELLGAVRSANIQRFYLFISLLSFSLARSIFSLSSVRFIIHDYSALFRARFFIAGGKKRRRPDQIVDQLVTIGNAER